MKKLLLSLTLFSSLLLFTGCPFSSDIPIDSPSVRVNEKLIGTWELRSNSESNYVVTKTDNFTYKFEKHSKNNSDVTNYFAYMSNVSGVQYLNLWEESSSDKKTYYFYKFEMMNDAMVKFIPITENIDEKFTTSTELKNFIAKNQNLTFFFEKDEDTYIKVK
jgi:hypothetical protein